MKPPPSSDSEAALQLDELHGASPITRIAAWLLIQGLALGSVPARAWARLRWRLFTQSQCCECRRITRHGWLPVRSRLADHHISWTWCRACARKAGIEV